MPGYPVPARCVATLILALLALTGFPLIANAAVLNVPSQYATIGAAVAAASDGDTIAIDPTQGPYSAGGDLNLQLTKSLTFESASSTSAVIDCGGSNDFIQALSSNNLNLTFQNLTFQDCSSVVFNCTGSNSNMIDIDSCVFTGLSSEALETDAANAISIAGCTITNNTGFILFSLTGGTISVTNSTFSDNTGCEFLTDQISGTITDCSFEANGTGGMFGGLSPVFWQDAPLTINNTSFTNNQAGEGGGAIGVNAATADTPLTLDSCAFAGNSITGGPGGAVYLQPNGANPSLVASDCIFLNNSSDTDGSAIGGGGDMQLVNCSFYGNSYTGGSPSGQGTISSDGSSSLTVTNSILYGNTTPSEISAASPPGSTTVTYSDIQGFTINGVNGNIQADPKYAGPAVGDLHLLSSSPCIGDGTATGAPATDFSQYVWGNTVSMGAYSPVHFGFTTPSDAASGVSFIFSVTATAADNTTTITNFADPIHFTSSDDAALLPDDTTLTNGTATLNATLNTTGSQTIAATDTSTSAISGTSSDITVSGPATHFSISAPATMTSYDPYSITVTALDAEGNIATGYTGTVHLTSTDPGFVNATGDSTLTNGVGNFNVTLKKAGNQTITATDTVNSSITGTSNNITVVPGPTVRFILTAPATATAGTAFNFTVTAQDLYGNTTPAYNGTVHFTSSDAQAVLPADSTLTDGVGTFSATLKTAGNQTITGTDTVTSSITGTSNTIAVTAGAATHFAVIAPGSATAATPFNFTVTAFDPFGNIAAGYTGTVHFTSTDGAATLPADSTLTNGTGTFSATLFASGGQTITATDTVTPSITGVSNEIAVTSIVALATFPAGLQMISAPADYTGFTPSQIFSPGPVNLAAWQPLMSAYVVTPTSPADTVRPGQGYWVRFAETTTLRDLGQHVDPTKPFSISLSQGWNMIGDPFAIDIPLSQVEIIVNGAPKPFPKQPHPGNPVMERLYTYPAGATAYQVETEALRRYTGYWLYAREDCTLVVNP